MASLPLAAFCAGVVDVGILEHLRLMVLSDHVGQGEVVVLCHWQALAVHPECRRCSCSGLSRLVSCVVSAARVGAPSGSGRFTSPRNDAFQLQRRVYNVLATSINSHGVASRESRVVNQSSHQSFFFLLQAELDMIFKSAVRLPPPALQQPPPFETTPFHMMLCFV